MKLIGKVDSHTLAIKCYVIKIHPENLKYIATSECFENERNIFSSKPHCLKTQNENGISVRFPKYVIKFSVQ